MARSVALQIESDAWRAEPGPILLLAGPGTGKTHQLARRVKYLVEDKKVPPETITIITFTREAAENMRRRIAEEDKPDVYLPPESRPERITTMHSLGLEIVRTYHDLLGLPEDFHILTDSRLRAAIFRDAALLADYGEREGKETDRLRQENARLEPGSASAKITEQYEKILRACQAIDYDDQILLACRILSDKSELRAEYTKAAQHLLIDEYQDINAGQRQLIDLLSQDARQGLFVVGDDDQSIYSFRGGDPKYIREFHREFGANARALCLVESRRCPDTVMHAGLCVLNAFDSDRVTKPTPTFAEKKQKGAKILVHNVPSDDEEAGIISRLVQKALPKRTVLVLVPAKQYARKIAAAFRRRKVSYTLPPSLDDSGFLMIQQVHDWTEQPNDNLSLRVSIEALCNSGVLGIPSRRAHSKDAAAKRADQLKRIAGLWSHVRDGKSLWEVLQDIAKGENATVRALHECLERLLRIDAKDVPIFLKDAAESLRPWANRQGLMDEINSWVDELRSRAQAGGGAARIMTLQAAKGLEADLVCVIGLTEGILPRDGLDQNGVAETARLAYVSMSRASAELHLFHARKRDASVTYLQKSYALTPSRFVMAIDAVHKEERYYQPRKAEKRPARRGAKQ